MKSMSLAAALALASLAGVAAADSIFDTGAPGGFFGFIGYDVSVAQSVAVAFTPSADYYLDDINVWIMSNDFDSAGRTYTLSLRPDALDGATEPSNTVIESWNIATAAVGWLPVLETVTPTSTILLTAGTTYWIVAESDEPAGWSPVWVWGSNEEPVLSGNIDFFSGPHWQTGYTTGSAPGTIVNGTLVPAPAALALFGIGGLVSGRRRR